MLSPEHVCTSIVTSALPAPDSQDTVNTVASMGDASDVVISRPDDWENTRYDGNCGVNWNTRRDVGGKNIVDG